VKRKKLTWGWYIAILIIIPITGIILKIVIDAHESVGPILIGLILLGLGIFSFRWKSKILKHGYITEGKVIEIISESGSKGSELHFPIIRFKDSENIERNFKLDFGSNLPLYHLGQIISIVYYKGEIHLAESEWKILYVLIALVGIGIIIFQILT